MHEKKEVRLEKSVMKEIKNGNIQIRSRYIFVVQKLALGGGLAFSLLLAMLFLNLSFFVMKVQGSLQFLSLGGLGVLVFLQSLPYLWIILALAFFIAAGTVLTRYDISYKKPFKVILAVLFCLIIVAGIGLAISGVNEVVEERVLQGEMPLLRPFYTERRGTWRNGLQGEILQVRGTNMLVETSDLKRVSIELTENTRFPDLSGYKLPDFRAGDPIRVVGKWEEERFQADAIAFVEDDRRMITPSGSLLDRTKGDSERGRFLPENGARIMGEPEEEK